MRVRTHPGEVLLHEFLRPMGRSAASLAQALQVPLCDIEDIVCGQKGIDTDLAAGLAREFGTSAAFWSNLQRAHEVSARGA